MTINVNIHEANTHLSRLLEQVAAGERVVISKAGTPVADLVPHQAATVTFGPGSSTGPGSPARHPGPAREPGPQPSQCDNAPVISVSMILVVNSRHAGGIFGRACFVGHDLARGRCGSLLCPSSRPQDRVCDVHAACPVAGAGPAD